MNMLSCALQSARRGLAVFRLTPFRKEPLRFGWQSEATIDPDKITALWGRCPHANVGISTGHDLLVIDLDGPVGEANFEALCTGRILPDTFQVKTRRGRHLYFRCLDHVPSRNGWLAPKVDVKACGGLVVGAGSIHPDDHEFRYTVLVDAPIADAPLWLIELCQGPEEEPRPPIELIPGDPFTAYLYAGALCKVAAALEGQRNSLAFWGGLRAAEQIAARCMPHELAESLMITAATRSGLPVREAARAVRSGIKAGL